MTNLASADGASPTNDRRVLGHPRNTVATITVHALLMLISDDVQYDALLGREIFLDCTDSEAGPLSQVA